MRVPALFRTLALAATAVGAMVVGTGQSQADSTGWFVSEGCQTYGETYYTGSGLQAYTLGVAFDSSPCNWVYVRGQYYAYPTWHLDVGPYWSYEPGDGLVGYSAPGGTIGDFLHSACDAGGPCSSADYEWSHYPDQ
jgi:hypothetical protein